MSNEQFNHLVFIPTQIISFHQNQLVERVYRGPSFLKIIHSSYEGIEENSLYGKVLVRKMLEKKVQYHELEEACRNAYNELVKRLDRRGISQDMNASNFLILDYDPVTKKVDMALIDHWAWNTPPKEQRRE